MKRTLMMAFVANPYLAVLQKRTYLKYWKNEVDEVLINVNGLNDNIRNFIAELWKDDKVKHIDNYPEEIRQGHAFNRLYPHAKGDIIITMDSDNFIFKKRVIDTLAKRMDKFNCVGSKGFHAFPYDVAKKCIDKWGTVRVNPFMAFFKKKHIDQIKKLDFSTTSYKKGTELDFYGTMPCDGWFDVMSEFCLRYFKECNGQVDFIPDADLILGYIHFGGVSSLYRRYFRNLENTNENTYKELMSNKQHPSYWVVYYLLFESTKNECPFEDYNNEYNRGLDVEIKKSINDNDFKKLVDSQRSLLKELFV